MTDRQFAIPAPWPEEPGKETMVMVDCFGSEDYVIAVGAETIRLSRTASRAMTGDRPGDGKQKEA